MNVIHENTEHSTDTVLNISRATDENISMLNPGGTSAPVKSTACSTLDQSIIEEPSEVVENGPSVNNEPCVDNKITLRNVGIDCSGEEEDDRDGGGGSGNYVTNVTVH